MSSIHPTAVLAPEAEIGQGARIGPHCVIGPGVILGDDCELRSHVTITGPSRIGPGNLFYPFSSIGERSQDLKYTAEPTYLTIGQGNSFREFCTVNRGTAPEATTRIGDRNHFLAYSHVAHDCTIGNDVIFSNNGTVAGHVEVMDHAIIGGLSGVHQFCRIGRHAIVGGCTKIVQDVPPFMIADGNPAEVRGVNVVGLERRGFAPETLRLLREAYRQIYRSNANVKQSLEAIREKLELVPEILELLQFIESSERGIIR
jgi:UDP-N-acetylglucosamine acyltransferase